MKYVSCFFVFSLIVSCCFGGNYFQRINEAENTLETACKIYRSKIYPRTEVRLIGMTHEALLEYYKEVERRIENTVVIYELYNGTIEMTFADLLLVSTLPPYLQERFVKAVAPNFPDALGLVRQKYALSYAHCTQAIHGDGGEDFKIKSRDETIESINEITLDKLRNYNISISADDVVLINQKLDALMLLEASEATRQELSESIRKELAHANLDVDLLKLDFTPADLDSEEEAQWTMVVRGRNWLVFNRLWFLLHEPNPPSVIAIPWGSVHMTFLEEEMLARLGFELESTEWLTAVRLLPQLPVDDIWEQQPEHQKEYRETFLSPDGTILIHCVGNDHGLNHLLASDWEFLSMAMSAETRGAMKNKTFEVAFTPQGGLSAMRKVLVEMFTFDLVRTKPYLRFDRNEIRVVGERIVW